MIRFLLLQNRQGKTRLSKWYVQPTSEGSRLQTESEIHRMVVSRDRKHTNFIEVRTSFQLANVRAGHKMTPLRTPQTMG